MSFWSVNGPEPKRNHRWFVRFGGNSLPNLTYALKKVDKPKNKIGETTHKFLNHEFYYPGRLVWEPINMTFASVTEPDATSLIDLVTILAGYGVPNAMNPNSQLSTIGKNKFNNAIGSTIDIAQVDANGEEIETWKLNNPFFTNIQYGTLDYSNEDIVEISTTVRYDWARLTLSRVPSDGPASPPINPGFPR